MDDNEIIEMYFRRDEQAIAETQTKYGRLCGKIEKGGSARKRPAFFI